MSGEKTQAVWDYSEHATITQGQLLEKSSKNAIFLKVMWKTPLFKRLSRPRRARESAIVPFGAGRATSREICRNGPMASGTDWRTLQQRISRAASWRREAWAWRFWTRRPRAREIRRHGAVRLQFLAAGRSRALFLHPAARALQLRGRRPHAQHSAFFRARERNRADAA